MVTSRGSDADETTVCSDEEQGCREELSWKPMSCLRKEDEKMERDPSDQKICLKKWIKPLMLFPHSSALQPTLI